MRLASLIINLALVKDMGKTAVLASESSVLLTFRMSVLVIQKKSLSVFIERISKDNAFSACRFSEIAKSSCLPFSDVPE